MLEEFSKELDYCTYCPKMCSFSCPVSTVENNESTTPWGKMQAANLVRKGLLPLTEEVAALAYKCTACRLCEQYCEHHIDVASILLDFRKLAVEQHVAPRALMGFLDKFHLHNNPFGKDLLAVLEPLVPEKYRNPHAQTAYFVGCATIAQTPEVIVDTFSLFDKLGVEDVCVYLDPIQCCGYPLVTGGIEEEFEDIAELHYQGLRRYRHIISASPSCVHTLKTVYAKYHFNLESRLMTMTQFLKPYIENSNYVLNKHIAQRFLYQDPCYLGRYLGEYDTPRQMLEIATSRPPLEFHENREKSACCGQGGCYSITSPEFSNEVSRRRLSEAKERHISTVVTHCPSCVSKLRKNGEGMKIMDIVSFLNEAIAGHD